MCVTTCLLTDLFLKFHMHGRTEANPQEQRHGERISFFLLKNDKIYRRKMPKIHTQYHS